MALNLKIKLLLWLASFQKEAELAKTPAPEFRKASAKQLAKLESKIDYPAIEMYHIHNQVITNQEAEIPIRIYQPSNRENMPILMYFHGGGFVINNLDTHDKICRRLAKMVDCVVISVDYRLAPEHKYPAASEDCYAATVWAYQHASEFKGNAQRIAVAGDSAGGNLATVVAMMARDKNGPKICYQVLIYPCTDGNLATESIEKYAEGYLLTKELMHWFLDHYKRNEADVQEAYFSPLLAENFQNMPPALVITAEYDPLIDEGRKYAEKLQGAGNQVIYTEYKGMIHAFLHMSKLVKKTRQAFEQIAKELRIVLGTNGIV